jgi:hypothetical protein
MQVFSPDLFNPFGVAVPQCTNTGRDGFLDLLVAYTEGGLNAALESVELWKSDLADASGAEITGEGAFQAGKRPLCSADFTRHGLPRFRETRSLASNEAANGVEKACITVEIEDVTWQVRKP